ncbi:MAG TPA: MFS transporter [Rhodanobacteraceae bacterium]|nr:MFS transporter [Rhodanobacteraceae bacterium]
MNPEGRMQGWLPRPFEGHYGISLAVSIIALVPFIVVSTADVMFAKQVQQALHSSQLGTQLISGFAIAAYAFGALLGGDLIQRFRQRHLFLVCEALFVLGCALAVSAPIFPVFGAGRVLMGLATGLLLVIALPPVILRFPSEKLPKTMSWVDLGFFGAVCAGPLVGGAVAAMHAWRWFFAGLGAIGLLNSMLALLTEPVYDPPNPGLPFDYRALLLGFGAVVLPFWATGELAAHGFASVLFTVLLAAGMACFVALLLVEYHQREPLSPVKLMWHTIAVIGTLVAMFAGSLFVSFLELAERLHLQALQHSPFDTGVLFSPMIGGVCITAALVGLLLRTRFLPILILAGMTSLIGGGVLILNLGEQGAALPTLAAAGLLGLGAGATVSPGLILAAFSVASRMVGRVFALVELVRSLADYVITPIILKIARVRSLQPPLDWPGVYRATEITLWLAVGFTVFGVALWMAGGAGLPVPNINAWIKESKPAIPSPGLLARFRNKASLS